MAVPSDKQNIRGVIVDLFPWLAGVVAVGKGLAIRAAGGVLHLMGGPGDPGVHRVGDMSKGPIITAAGPVITITNPDDTTIILTDVNGASSWTVTGTVTTPGQTMTKASTGSKKVTSA